MLLAKELERDLESRKALLSSLEALWKEEEKVMCKMKQKEKEVSKTGLCTPGANHLIQSVSSLSFEKARFSQWEEGMKERVDMMTRTYSDFLSSL